ncbi:hypothetical protein CS912_07475 (plasmid) [Klebsiella variicola]|nr:hypothetical protein CS911_11035 [Klebsiella variicola]PIA11301.1 hypothetical protein CS912_07475 [Klebsiella variicola]
MTVIVVLAPLTLNAHFCRCLAYFSMWLENCRQPAHNVWVKKHRERRWQCNTHRYARY